jgi:hypothetical protein
VRILDAAQAVVLDGGCDAYPDGSGEVVISLATGDYVLEVESAGGWRRGRVHVAKDCPAHAPIEVALR